jgi:hypothetical protein
MIIINGPTTVNYDEDLGVLPVSDWYYQTASARAYVVAHFAGRPPTTADNGLINSTMVSKSGTGKYAVTTMNKGKKYKLRLINAAVDNHFVVSLDNHHFTVVAADFVPIKPFTTTNLFIAIGQRYDVIISANQKVGNYWFRAEVQDQAGPDCGLNANNGNIKSIFRYQGAPVANPTTTGPTYAQRCSDEVVVPYWDSFVPKGPLEKGGDLNSAINIGVTAGNTVVTWGINTVAMNVNWNQPVLGQVFDGNTTFDRSSNVITLPEADQVCHGNSFDEQAILMFYSGTTGSSKKSPAHPSASISHTQCISTAMTSTSLALASATSPQRTSITTTLSAVTLLCCQLVDGWLLLSRLTIRVLG